MLRADRHVIDELNVFPVADHDTGANLVSTLSAAAAAVQQESGVAGSAVLAAMARGAVDGARGNSGLIISQFLYGMADSAIDEIDGRALAAAFDRGAIAAYASVQTKVEGTILTVAKAAAEAARRHSQLDEVASSALHAAEQALARTPTQLPELARAGVVDAGARGFVVILRALALVISPEIPVGYVSPVNAFGGFALEVPRETGSADYSYEVQYLWDASPVAAEQLRGKLGELGDSLVVGSVGDGRWKVHVHVNDIGGAIEAGISLGRPHRINVVRFADPVSLEQPAIAVVAIAPGHGLNDLFLTEGVLIAAGQDSEAPKFADVMGVINSTGSASVVLLPNHRETFPLAEQAAKGVREAGRQAVVVPTRSPVQALAAIAVHDATRRFDDDVVAMAEAAAATRWAEVTIAANEALTMVGRCQAGDVLGLIGDDVVLIGQSIQQTVLDLVAKLLATGGELVTVVLGASADENIGVAMTEFIATGYPAVEISIYHGGQTDNVVIVGVE